MKFGKKTICVSILIILGILLFMYFRQSSISESYVTGNVNKHVRDLRRGHPDANWLYDSAHSPYVYDPTSQANVNPLR
jgi:uncharacterized membrane protein YoaK (UPF0700 family)